MVSEGDFHAHVVTAAAAAAATAADDDDRRLRIRHLLFASTRISFLGRALLYDCCCCCCWFTFFFGCPVEGAIYYISHRIQPCRSGSNMIFSVFLVFFFSALFCTWIALRSHHTLFSCQDDSCRCTAFVLMCCYNSIDSRKIVWWHCFRATLACLECMFFPAQTGCVTFDSVFAFDDTMTAISGERHNTDEHELRTNNIQIRLVF